MYQVVYFRGHRQFKSLPSTPSYDLARYMADLKNKAESDGTWLVRKVS